MYDKGYFHQKGLMVHTVLDADFLAYIKPFYDRGRGSAEIIRLCRLARLVESGMLAAAVAPAAPPKPEPIRDEDFEAAFQKAMNGDSSLSVQAPAQKVNPVEDVDDSLIEDARRKLEMSFGGFD